MKPKRSAFWQWREEQDSLPKAARREIKNWKIVNFLSSQFSTLSANHNGKIYRQADDMGRELRETLLPFLVLARRSPIRCRSRPDGDHSLAAWHTVCHFPASRCLFNFYSGRLISCKRSDRSSWAWPFFLAWVSGSPCRKLLFIAGIFINLVLADHRPRCAFGNNTVAGVVSSCIWHASQQDPWPESLSVVHLAVRSQHLVTASRCRGAELLRCQAGGSRAGSGAVISKSSMLTGQHSQNTECCVWQWPPGDFFTLDRKHSALCRLKGNARNLTVTAQKLLCPDIVSFPPCRLLVSNALHWCRSFGQEH